MHAIEHSVIVGRPVGMVFKQWTQFDGVPNAGTVRFKPLGDDQTEVHLLLAYEPDGAYAGMGHALGRVSKRVKQALLDFRDFAERHALPPALTNSWQIRHPARGTS